MNCSYCNKQIDTSNDPPEDPWLSALKPTNGFTCSEQCSDLKRAEKNKERLLSLYQRLLKVMPAAYKNLKISDFDDMQITYVIAKRKVKAKDIIDKFCTEKYWNVTFASVNYGNGKTRICLFILARLLYHGIYRTHEIGNIQDAGYYSAIDMVKLLKTESFDAKQYIFRKFMNSSVLMIDDLGQEDLKDSAIVAGILKNREENQKKTIITTNLTKDELEARYSGRISSRIAKGLFYVEGEDYREK